jgi:DNA-binding response OmpR family regulator
MWMHRRSVDVLVITAEPSGDTVVPALSLLGHSLRTARRDVDAVTAAQNADVAFVDARSDLSAAREMCRYLATASPAPVVAVVKTGDMLAVDPGWEIDDILSPEAGPAELDARLRLLTGRRPDNGEDTEIRLGELIMNERTYSARLQGRPLHLTHQEFELLKYLVAHPGRVFTRRHLLQEVGVQLLLRRRPHRGCPRTANPRKAGPPTRIAHHNRAQRRLQGGRAEPSKVIETETPLVPLHSGAAAHRDEGGDHEHNQHHDFDPGPRAESRKVNQPDFSARSCSKSSRKYLACSSSPVDRVRSSGTTTALVTVRRRRTIPA